MAEGHDGKVQFCKCDVMSWEVQVEMFKAATAKSPGKSCDVVIANAGVSGLDGLFKMDGTDFAAESVSAKRGADAIHD